MALYDVAIIGAGICGAAVAYMLKKYDLKICVLEKETDVAMGTTKANSAIIHAGYDPETETKMAKHNVAGSILTKEICEKLSVPYSQIGSFVISFNDEDEKTIDILHKRGIENGVKNLKILNSQEIKKLEPNLSANIKSALFAPTAAIVSPWELDIAMLETAILNGCELFLESLVTAVSKENGYFKIQLNNKPEKSIKAKFIVNAAGLYADVVNDLITEHSFSITPNKGQYFLLDKSQNEIVNHVIFQCPSKDGKGVLVSPTVGGNLIVGPDSNIISDEKDLSTNSDGLEFIRKAAKRTTDKVNFRENIRNFAGNRAVSDRDDFIIEISPTEKNLINVAGIKSPGLSSAPSIALEVVSLLEKSGLKLIEKSSYIDNRKKIRFAKLSVEEKTQIIKKDSAYGNIICRCNQITEGEILDTLKSPIPPKTLDGVKRRVSSGMGRCQGGFCSPKIHEILSKELNLPMEEIELEKKGSYIVIKPTKQGTRQEESNR